MMYMKITNHDKIKVKINKKTFLVKNCRGAKSIKGLMFDSMQDKDGALIYANNIWMPFVKQKLDLLFLDKDLNVLKQERAVPLTFNPKTWKVYRCDDAKYCLELKAGIVNRKITKIFINTPPSQ